MKGVLAPSEANAIQNAAPTDQFEALVNALARKGVVSAADLSAIAGPGLAATCGSTRIGGSNRSSQGIGHNLCR